MFSTVGDQHHGVRPRIVPQKQVRFSDRQLNTAYTRTKKPQQVVAGKLSKQRELAHGLSFQHWTKPIVT